jgi:hypothetical protein
MTGDELRAVLPISMDLVGIGSISGRSAGLAELDGTELASCVQVLVLVTKSAICEKLA